MSGMAWIELLSGAVIGLVVAVVVVVMILNNPNNWGPRR